MITLRILNQYHEAEYDCDGNLVGLPAIEEEDDYEEIVFYPEEYDSKEELLAVILSRIRREGCYEESSSLPLRDGDWFIRPYEINQYGEYHSTSCFLEGMNQEDWDSLNRIIRSKLSL